MVGKGSAKRPGGGGHTTTAHRHPQAVRASSRRQILLIGPTGCGDALARPWPKADVSSPSPKHHRRGGYVGEDVGESSRRCFAAPGRAVRRPRAAPLIDESEKIAARAACRRPPRVPARACAGAAKIIGEDRNHNPDARVNGPEGSPDDTRNPLIATGPSTGGGDRRGGPASAASASAPQSGRPRTTRTRCARWCATRI